MESDLYNKVNECLQNEKFKQLPVSLIFRIITKSTEENISNDLLLDFISKSIEEYYCLFTFIDIQNLSTDNLNELIKLYNKRKDDSYQSYFQYFPPSFWYIKSINEENAKLDNKNKELNDLKAELNNQIIQLSNQNSELNSQTKHLNNQNKELKDQIKKLTDQNKESENQIKKLTDRNKESKDQNKQLTDRNKELED